ncbi:MAG: 1,4-dihydroxy-2-naphthoate octaprenyltransferase [Cyclobacteriaceae bacterium]|jgi:1,4-dihydroxy-2-naphthoate octaprenyltransferase
MVSLLQYFKWLSLDIALGGAIFLLFIANLLHVEIGWPIYLALSSSILLIYTIDHLIDGADLESPSLGRHHFHKSHRFFVYLLIIALLLLLGICLFFMPKAVMISGALIASICGLYLLIQKRLAFRGTKEIFIAVIFAIAMTHYPFILLRALEVKHLILSLQIAGIAFLNLLVIASYDVEVDQMERRSSLATKLGNERVRIVIVSMAVLLFSSASILMMIGLFSAFQLWLLLAVSVLVLVYSFVAFFRKRERYRWASDFIFLLAVFF